MSDCATQKPTRESTFLKQFGIEFDSDLLTNALIHRSYANEHSTASNERLEFLGDAVLEIIVTDEIFKRFAKLPEGELSKIRAALVSEEPLAALARKISLDQQILLGRGEEKDGGREKDSILSDALEALIAAIYLEKGYSAAQGFVLELIRENLEALLDKRIPLDMKAALRAKAHRLGFGEVVYSYTETGKQHEMVYSAQVSFSKSDLFNASACATSKKKAALQASEQAYQKLQEFAKTKERARG